MYYLYQRKEFKWIITKKHQKKIQKHKIHYVWFHNHWEKYIKIANIEYYFSEGTVFLNNNLLVKKYNIFEDILIDIPELILL